VIAKINDNAYSIDIPIADFRGVSNSFNVADLSPYDGDDLGASSLTPFEGGMMRTSLLHSHVHQLLMIQLLLLIKDKSNDEFNIGPITQARAMLLEQQVNSLLIESDIYYNENFILPKSLFICMIRFIGEEGVRGSEEMQHMEHDVVIKEESAREEREVGATSMEDNTT
jgi:hypothetical protein